MARQGRLHVSDSSEEALESGTLCHGKHHVLCVWRSVSFSRRTGYFFAADNRVAILDADEKVIFIERYAKAKFIATVLSKHGIVHTFVAELKRCIPSADVISFT